MFVYVKLKNSSQLMVFTVGTVYQAVKPVKMKEYVMPVKVIICYLMIKLDAFWIAVLGFIIQVHLAKDALLDAQIVDHSLNVEHAQMDFMNILAAAETLALGAHTMIQAKNALLVTQTVPVVL